MLESCGADAPRDVEAVKADRGATGPGDEDCLSDRKMMMNFFEQ